MSALSFISVYMYLSLKSLILYLLQLYLRSELATHTVRAKKTPEAQEVAVDSQYNASCVWKAEHADQRYALEWDGEPVRANFPLLLRHVSTNELLYADPSASVLNDFGSPEIEVSCKHNRRDPMKNLFCMVMQNSRPSEPSKNGGDDDRS